MNRVLILTAFGMLQILMIDRADGQLFGSRSVTRSMARQNPSTVGQIQGNERFIRGRRGRRSFVGADQNDQAGFVGNQQARTAGRIASPTGGMKRFSDQSGQINKPYPSLGKNEVYPSIIVLPKDWFANTGSSPVLQKQLASLTSELRRKVNDSIEVSVADRVAKLRGVVPSARQKSLAELLILFEPGIDEVRNEIEVSSR